MGHWTGKIDLSNACGQQCFQLSGGHCVLLKLLFLDLALVAVRAGTSDWSFQNQDLRKHCVGGTVSFSLNVLMSRSTDRFSKHDKRLETIDGVLGMAHATDWAIYCRGHLVRYEVDAPTLNHRVETVQNVGRHWTLLEQQNVHQDFAVLVHTWYASCKFSTVSRVYCNAVSESSAWGIPMIIATGSVGIRLNIR